MRRLSLVTRDELRCFRVMTRCHWLEIKWIRLNTSRREVTASHREAIGDEVLAKLSELADRLDRDLADSEGRLSAQHSIGMLQSRVALDLGRRDEAMRFATQFNGRCQLLLNLAQEEGWIADKPTVIRDLTKMNKDLYDEVMAASIDG
jgi:hypothetical protein